jgi:hypothetical protein
MDQFAQYKARWVVCGLTQEHSVDYKETFSLVIKPAIVRVVLSIATSKDWPIHELNVKNAFLHGNLTETIFAQQPSGFFLHHTWIMFASYTNPYMVSNKLLGLDFCGSLPS